MPVEIRELHIRVTVDGGAAKSAATAGGRAHAGEAEADRDAIVAECVEQVLQILQTRKER
ncbi:DUF5908 family protein [Sphingobium rhizovicinum]|uniref:DUF5908 family protein n=1 Tax=Sphingobium rhizovicinum TaxID=432308 RepID=A0ABV7NLC0_9SPHN